MSTLNYPNLEACDVRLASSSGCNILPPPGVDPACSEAIRAPLPSLYDFHIEKRALEPKPIFNSTTDYSSATTSVSNTPERMRRDSLARMMSITNASEDLCASILEGQGHDLEASVNVFMNNH